MGTKRDIGVNLGHTRCLLTATNMQFPGIAVSFNDAAQLLWLVGVEALCDTCMMRGWKEGGRSLY